MTPLEIEAFGMAYYGDRWIEPLAADLGVNRSTVWRWATGRSPVGTAVAAQVQLLGRKLRRRGRV